MNANRQITGTLRGFDQFMNLVLDGTVDVKNKVDIGMVVSGFGVWTRLDSACSELLGNWVWNGFVFLCPLLFPTVCLPLVPAGGPWQQHSHHRGPGAHSLVCVACSPKVRTGNG
eukprot:1159488-Pelagomonas_calceolata.AAC.2